jgi:hypothetical protein
MRWSWLLCAGCAEFDREWVLTLEPGVWACDPGMQDEVLPLLEEPMLREGEHEIRVFREGGYHLVLGGQVFEGDRLGNPLSSLSIAFTLVSASRDDKQDRFIWMREALYIHQADEEASPSYQLSQHHQVLPSEFPECEWQAERRQGG